MPKPVVNLFTTLTAVIVMDLFEDVNYKLKALDSTVKNWAVLCEFPDME